jgi:hypothetical protein
LFNYNLIDPGVSPKVKFNNPPIARITMKEINDVQSLYGMYNVALTVYELSDASGELDLDP